MSGRLALVALAVLTLLTAGAVARPRSVGPVREIYGPPTPPAPPTPYDQCDRAIAAARPKVMPDTLLSSIARVESGRLDPATGRVRPWPWTINVDGVGSFFESKTDAVAAVRALQEKGHRSVDVGCMQVNLMYHPGAFPDLDTAFDPPSNATYAVRFLTALFGQTRNWPLAAAMYHSAEQERGEDYQRRVFGRVLTPMGPPTPAVASKWPPAGAMFAAIPPASTKFAAFAPVASPFGAFAVPGIGTGDGTPPGLRGLGVGITVLPGGRRR